ncbi:protein of unknown function [Virgibacillus subterraneus]|uniref:DUF4166 domain-containing protein n=1 Tax=Virgibacillus subterraneus TaxID=621109 RepID=A0A1H9HS85_9BACI|nr:DUF4166 domain-containing protein [Virgibacillus subterraneus]SEQ65191.1 protein of unknown function [Virgibacillus subterraneus]
MSIYKRVMGKDFYRLHPMLQKRYEIQRGMSFTGTGMMESIKGGPKWLFPLFWTGVKFKLLFPEHGENIPFKIVNTPETGRNGEEQIRWERTFYFGTKKRYFNALMSLDSERNIIKDYLGEPHLFYSDLSLDVTAERALKITSKRQRLVLGRLEIPLPTLFQGLATVTEKYVEEKDAYSIHVIVRNPLIGTLFSYEGEFTADDIS